MQRSLSGLESAIRESSPFDGRERIGNNVAESERVPERVEEGETTGKDVIAIDVIRITEGVPFPRVGESA